MQQQQQQQERQQQIFTNLWTSSARGWAELYNTEVRPVVQAKKWDDADHMPNDLYIITPVLERPARALVLYTEAKDQGWGNTNYSRVVVSAWVGSERVASQTLDTVSYSWKRTSHAWSSRSEGLEQRDFVRACTRGARIAVTLCSPSWGGHECLGRFARVSVFYSHLPDAAVLRRLVARHEKDFDPVHDPESAAAVSFVFGGCHSAVFCPDNLFSLIARFAW